MYRPSRERNRAVRAGQSQVDRAFTQRPFAQVEGAQAFGDEGIPFRNGAGVFDRGSA